MANSPAPTLSLRGIGAQVNRSHVQVRHLLIRQALTDCAPTIRLAAAHLVFTYRVPAEVAATWARSTSDLPANGWLAHFDGAVHHLESPAILPALLGNPDLADVHVIRVDSLTYRPEAATQGVAA